MIERIIETPDGVRLRTYEVGCGQPVLIVNGLGGTPDAWRRVIERFRDRFRFLTWDYRGLYGSSRPEATGAFSVGHHVEDARLVLRHFGVDRAVVMGWSMGVQVSLALALAAPESVRALTLINGTYGSPLGTAFDIPWISAVLPRAVQMAIPLAPVLGPVVGAVAPSQWLLDLGIRVGFAGPTIDREVLAAVTGRWGELDFDAFFRNLAALGDHDAGPDLVQVAAPTLIIHGDRDALTPHRVTQRMLDELRDASLFTVVDGSHYSILEHPHVVNERLEEFLAPFSLAAGSLVLDSSP